MRTPARRPWLAESELRFGAAITLVILVLELFTAAHAAAAVTLSMVLVAVLLGSAFTPVGLGTVVVVARRRRRALPQPVNSGGSSWPTWSSSR